MTTIRPHTAPVKEERPPADRSPTTTDDIATKTSLLTIPPELRLEIYEHYFAAFEFDFNASEESAPSDFQPPLLHTCKLIQKEALPIYKVSLESRRKSIEECADQEQEEIEDAQSQTQDRMQFFDVERRSLRVAMELMRRNMALSAELGKISTLRRRELDGKISRLGLLQVKMTEKVSEDLRRLIAK